jgi:hypothetical protein
MEEYINEEGDLYTIEEINQTAKENNTTFDDIIKRNKLALKPKKQEKVQEVKVEVPGKRKSVAMEDAGATVKSTVSKSVKPSSALKSDIWGKDRSKPEFLQEIQKASQPKVKFAKPVSIEKPKRELKSISEYQEKVKEEGESGFSNFLKESFDSGISTIVQSAYKAPEFLYDATAAFITDPIANLANDIIGVERQDSSSEKIMETFGIKNIPADILQKRINESNKIIQDYSAKNGVDPLTAIENGNYLGAAKLVAGGTIQSVPMMAAAMFSGGSSTALAGISASTAISKAEQLKIEQPEMDVQTRTINAAASGLLEGYLGNLFTGASGAVVKKILTDKGIKEGSKIVSNGLINTLENAIEKNPMIGVLGEVAEESSVELGNQLNDMNSGLRKELDYRAITNAGIIATGMAGTNTIPVYGAKGYMKVAEYNQVKAVNKEINTLTNQLSNPYINDSDKKIISSRVNRLVDENKTIVGASLEKIKALPENIKTEINTINTDLDDIKSKYLDLTDNDAIPLDVKAAMGEELKLQGKQLYDRKNSIIEGNYIYEDFNKLSNKEQSNFKNEATNYLIKENEKNNDTSTPKPEIIDRKAVELYNNQLRVTNAAKEIELVTKLATTEKVPEITNGIGENKIVEIFDTPEDLQKAYNKYHAINKFEGEARDVTKEAGFAIGDQIVINKAIAENFEEGDSVGRHELLHKILKSSFSNSEAGVNLKNKFLDVLSTKERTVIEKRLKDRGYTEEDLANAPDEYLTQFFEALDKKEIKYSDTSFLTMWKTFLQPIYKKLGFRKLDFKSGADVYNFVKDYHKNATKGILSERALALKEKGIDTGIKEAMSKTPVELVKEKIADLEESEGDYDPYEYDQEVRKLEGELKRAIAKEGTTPTIKKEVSEEDTVKEIIKNESGSISSNKVQQIYETKGKEGAAEIIKLFKPITNKIVDKRRDAPDFDRELLTDEIETGVGGILDLITKYKPESGTPLAAWINKYLPVRAIATSRRILGKQFSKDASEEKGLMATETADQGFAETAKEKPKYKNVLELKVFAPDVLESATKKIISVVRTLKSRIDAPISLNRTITPLISEIRDEIGKQLDIDVKTAMGGKKDNQLQNWLLDNKQYVLENMTTTWLMGKDGQGGMPIAIQKQIDGKWTNFPEWVGKKIDREKTTTDQAGRTSGAELVRRLPNVNNNISDSQFLDQVIGPDGNPLRGRKESLAKAVAEEAAFDIINEDLANGGIIFEALSANQQRQGVEIAENFAVDFERQADRGNVKFSKVLNEKLSVQLNENITDKKVVNIITGMISQIIQPTATKRKKGLLDIEDTWNKKLGNDLYNEMYDTYLKPIADALETLQVTASGKRGNVAENLAIDTIKSINNKDFKLISVKGAGVGSHETDVEFKYKDVTVKFEIKSNKADRLTSLNIHNYTKKNTSTSRIINNKNKTNLITQIKESKKFNDFIEKAIAGGATLTDNGSLEVTPKYLADLNKTGSIYSKTLIPLTLDLNIVEDIYKRKGVNYIGFGDIGMFYVGNNPLGLKVPKLDGKLYSKAFLHPGIVKVNGKITLTLKVYTQLTTSASNDLSAKSKNSIYSPKSWETLFSNILPNKIEYLKSIENNKTAVITNDAVLKSLKLSKTPKGISVFDFDDTVGLTKGSVLYTMPDGTKGKLNAEGFAKEGSSILEAGGIFDFSEFSKVVNGKPGPMVEKMKKMIGKFGPENFFILTARPANAAGPIHEFLSSIGINIPLKNITGLGSSLAQSKADWMTAKAAEGYNDFYFADDAIQNVEAVKKALEVPGITSKVQQARLKFSLTSKKDLKWKTKLGLTSSVFKVGEYTYDIKMASIKDYGLSDDIELFKAFEEIAEKLGLPLANLTNNQNFNWVSFAEQDEGSGILDTGNSFKVFGIVTNGLIDYIQKNNIEGIAFNAEGPSRIRLYKTLANTIGSRLGWDYNAVDTGDEETGTVFVINSSKSDSFNNQSKQIKDVLNVVDVKSKIQQAKIKFSKTISSEFNKIISKNTGIGPAISYSDIVAKRKGANKNLFDLYVPASSADFELLLYNFLGKGKEGEAQMKFFSDALLKPYANGNDLMDAARQSIKNNYKELIKAFPGIAKKLEKLTPDGNFTYDQALRVAMWNGSDVEIPGLSKTDTKALTSLVNNDAELYDFMSGLVVLGRQGNGWVKPGDNWDASTIISDLHNLTEGDGRKQFLAEFIDNAQEMFGKWDNGKLVGPNINKVEAIYGTDVRESIEDVLYRMTSGKNRSQGKDKITNAWLNWVSGSTGTIMFLNTRSAALQLIGAVNFLNLRDNNPFAAGAAFANQPQYWKDFAKIWNSNKMKERRGGLKEDVAAAEIANAAATSKNKPAAVISYLLKIGYTPTQLADSFAIASGGAPFYRNRIKSYLKEGLTEQEAEDAAWNDFTKVSDETQQSGDPRDISKQQASGAGRLLLTFQNTAMQQSRIVKKSFLDLKNGRGDAKTHIAKITYYLAIQNLMFSALQQGLFAVLFHEEDEDDEAKKKRLKEKDKKAIEIASGVVDTVVRGTGLLGGVLVTLKNVIKKYMEEEPKGYKADYTKVVLEATNISPPIGSKVRKIYSGLQQTKFDKDLIKERGWGVMQDGRVHLGPMYSIAGKGVEATVNFPMERLVNKVENTSQMFNSQNQAWQRIALGLGWNPRSVGIEETKGDIAIEAKAKEVRKEEGKIKGAETRARTKDSIRALPMAERIKLKREAALKRREEKIKKRNKRKMG